MRKNSNRPSKKDMIDMYYKLVLCRQADDRIRGLAAGGIITGLFHLGSGQEAMPVAAGSLLRKEDYMKVDYRGISSAIAKGVPLQNVLASFFNRKVKSGDPFQGHWFAPDYGLLGISNTLGEDIAIYVGAALSSKIRGTDQVTVCFFGDGTANRGPVHESLNMASLWKLPIVFICENNEYGISLHVSKSTAGGNISARAVGYGIPGRAVDGNDVLECYKVLADAVDRARSEGPSLIEAKTYRMRGHWEGDPQVYRSPAEVEKWQTSDPILRFKKFLLDSKVLSKKELQNLESKAAKEVATEVEKALSLPEFELEDLMTPGVTRRIDGVTR